MFVVVGLLFSDVCWLPSVWSALRNACCLLLVCRCSLLAIGFLLLFVVWCVLLSVVCCVMLVVGCCWCLSSAADRCSVLCPVQ